MRKPFVFRSTAIFGLVVSSLMLPAPVFAHHSYALFDSSKTVTLQGTVKEFEWTNPHSWIHLIVVDANNQPEEWLIELPAAASLARDGWNKNFVKPGEHLSMRINPLKNGMRVGSLQNFRTDSE